MNISNNILYFLNQNCSIPSENNIPLNKPKYYITGIVVLLQQLKYLVTTHFYSVTNILALLCKYLTTSDFISQQLWLESYNKTMPNGAVSSRRLPGIMVNHCSFLCLQIQEFHPSRVYANDKKSKCFCIIPQMTNKKDFHRNENSHIFHSLSYY